MATIRIKRGLEANRTSVTPVEGEMLYTTDNKKLFIGDGSTAGGVALDLTATEVLNLLATVDGTGSGLDADTLDGVEGTNFLRSDQDDTTTGTKLHIAPSGATDAGFEIGYVGGAATTPYIDFHSGATAIDYDTRIQSINGDGNTGGGEFVFDAVNSDFPKITADQVSLDNISSQVTTTGSPAVFIYDTTKDSDGGAWRENTTNTSWYNETLNTTTRGKTRKFPAVVVIIAEVIANTSHKLTLYDATDPTLPMWMIFLNGAFLDFANIKEVSMMNGFLTTVSRSSTNTGGLVRYIDFIGDYHDKLAPLTGHSTTNNSRSIINRNVPGTDTVLIDPTHYRHESSLYVGIKQVVVKGTPINLDRGLPNPTIFIYTEEGITRIAHDGTSTSWTDSGGSVELVTNCMIVDDHVFFGVDNTASGKHVQVQRIDSLLRNATFAVAENYAGRRFSAQGNTVWTELLKPISYGGLNPTINSSENLAFATSNGVFKIVPEAPRFAFSMNATITNTFNTGYQFADIKGAFCVDTATTSLVGGTDNDRSSNNNAITVNGTVTRSVVATNTDLVAYNGWTASNYLSQAYSTDLDFGTGDFNVMLWFKMDQTDTGTKMLFERGVGGLLDCFFNSATTSLAIRVNNQSHTNTNLVKVGEWYHLCVSRRNGVVSVYFNGVKADAFDSAGDISGTTPILYIGKRSTGDSFANGHIALFKIGKEAPTEEQIKRIYTSEFHMFQENAKCVLSSSGNAVAAVAYDTHTRLHHYAGTVNLDTFDDLVRVDSEAGVYTSLAANNGIVIKGTL